MKFFKTDLVPEYQVVRSEVRKTFQMIDALPFVRPDDVDMVAFAGYIEYNWLWTSSSDPPSKSLDGTSGILGCKHLRNSSILQRLLGLTQAGTFNHRSENCQAPHTENPLLHDRRNGLAKYQYFSMRPSLFV